MSDFNFTDFFFAYVWPVIIMAAESILLLVCLLVAIAYVLYADRKIWAAVQMRRGPNVVGPWGLFQSFADMLKFVLQGAGDSGRREQGRVPAGAAGVLRAGARRLGGDPGQCRLGDLRHQCRHLVHFRHLVARRLRHHHGRLGVEFEISVPGGAALGGADGVLRGLHRLRHHHRAVVRRFAEPLGHRRGAGTGATACSPGTGCRCFRCSWSSSSRRWPKPTGRRSIWWKRNPNWSPASWSNTAPRLTCCSCSANTWRSAPCAPWSRSCSSAAGCRRCRSRRSPGCRA